MADIIRFGSLRPHRDIDTHHESKGYMPDFHLLRPIIGQSRGQYCSHRFVGWAGSETLKWSRLATRTRHSIAAMFSRRRESVWGLCQF